MTPSFEPDRAIGFDVSVSDKDEDGSFSWAAWGSGTQKLDMPDRVGEFFLVSPGTRFGEVSGLVAWKEPSQASLPSRVRIQSTRTAPLWREAPLTRRGPTGPRPFPRVPTPSAPWIRRTSAFDAKTSVDVRVEADRVARADLLRVTPIPWPGLIGAEGVLAVPGR